MSRWLNASASAGSSRNVGTNDVLSRTDPPAVPSAGFARAILPWGEPRGGPSRPPSTLFGVGGFIRALDAGVVDEALDGLAAEDVGLEDLLEVLLLDARVPHVVGIDHDHRTVAALREAAGLVDPHVGLEPGAHGFGPQELDVRFDVAPGRAVLTAGAHEDVRVVLAHQAPPLAALGRPLGPRSGGPSGRRLDGPSLRYEPIDFFTHRLHDLFLRDLADDLTVLEDEPDTAPAGHADVGRARFAGTVDLAAHHRDVDLLVEPAELVLDVLGELDEIDVGPAARRTRHEREPALAQPERLEDVDAHPDFF